MNTIYLHSEKHIIPIQEFLIAYGYPYERRGSCLKLDIQQYSLILLTDIYLCVPNLVFI